MDSRLRGNDERGCYAVTITPRDAINTIDFRSSSRNQSKCSAMLLMIDNYDSFTYNLVQYLGELGQDVRVMRNDELSVEQIRKLAPERIVVSPGPGTPDQAGITLEMISKLGGQIPIFGVCLGHQCIGQVFGGHVIRAQRIMHGKTSMIHHSGKGVFAALPNPFEATRYHSLIVEKSTLPQCLEVTAWTQNADDSVDEIMGLRHRTLAIEGVQFHPESILTQHGHALLRNFLHTARLAA
jgi:anthranilate synthase component 2